MTNETRLGISNEYTGLYYLVTYEYLQFSILKG